MNITESVFISEDIFIVFEAFANLQCWTKILPDVTTVDVLYDDGKNQEYLMTVKRQDAHETIRGIRYIRPPFEIELFQPVPPPNLKRMVGIWQFKRVERGTLVTATRKFKLQADPASSLTYKQRVREFSENLRNYLRTNLSLFKTEIEARGKN